MQSLYAFNQSQNDNLGTEEKFLLKSMEEMYDLFLVQLSLIEELKGQAENFLEKSQQKHLATSEEKDPNKKFISNAIFEIFKNNESLQDALESRKITHWKRDDDYVQIIWEALKKSDIYENYMETRESSFKEDKEFIIAVFKEIIAPNEKLYDYLEDAKLTWIDDLPIVNTAVLKFLQKLKPNSAENMKLGNLYKNDDDKDFAKELFRKTYLNDDVLAKEMLGKTPNWDKDRIAEIDMILMKMAICEFLKFPSIPVKVTINEYLELAKEYSTPKSSIFINGVLDKICRDLKKNKKLTKE